MSSPEDLEVTFADVCAASERIGSLIRRTPLLPTSLLPGCDGMAVSLKCENLQWGAAFKARGALNAVLSLSAAEASCGVVTHSSGNHAQAIAYAARVLGTQAFIVMPNNSPKVKVDAVR
ncbi:MAG: pyridoxal-phosphate dependent enzyme, partial [Planctomycetaceae bacterium]